MTRMIQGGCLCGEVRYTAVGEPINVRACHCRLCQRAIGAPFNVRALYNYDAVTISGPVKRFASSDWLDRGFCPNCGTTLFSDRPSHRAIGLTFGSMDDPNACPPPGEHIWTASQQAWLCIDDDLPRHVEGAPL